MRARQPSVPKTIGGDLWSSERWSQVIVLLCLGKSINDRANVLRPVGGAHEDDIRGVDDDRIGQPNVTTSLPPDE